MHACVCVCYAGCNGMRRGSAAGRKLHRSMRAGMRQAPSPPSQNRPHTQVEAGDDSSRKGGTVKQTQHETPRHCRCQQLLGAHRWVPHQARTHVRLNSARLRGAARNRACSNGHHNAGHMSALRRPAGQHVVARLHAPPDPAPTGVRRRIRAAPAFACQGRGKDHAPACSRRQRAGLCWPAPDLRKLVRMPWASMLAFFKMTLQRQQGAAGRGGSAGRRSAAAGHTSSRRSVACLPRVPRQRHPPPLLLLGRQLAGEGVWPAVGVQQPLIHCSGGTHGQAPQKFNQGHRPKMQKQRVFSPPAGALGMPATPSGPFQEWGQKRHSSSAQRESGTSRGGTLRGCSAACSSCALSRSVW